MKLSTEIISVHLRWSFATSRGRMEGSRSAIVRIEHEGLVGLGEATMDADACGGRPEPVDDYVPRIIAAIQDDPFQIERIMEDLARLVPEGHCTRAGIDIALHDLCGKLTGIPLARLLGLSPERTPLTSYTIGLDSIPVMLQKVREARDYPILKIKVGAAGDVEAVRAIRQETDAVLRVDANGGWSVQEAIDRIGQMEESGIQFVEQPIQRGDPEGLRTVRERTHTPIFADEDAKTARDLPPLAGCVDGINIKLMECGGLREALRMIHVARALDMQVMLGCMVETSLSLTAAAHLSPLADYADLDSALLLADDPFIGLKIRGGRITLPQGPGLGVVRRLRQQSLSRRNGTRPPEVKRREDADG